jgi:DNA-binding NarL/FixJ family response regulator
MRYRLAVVDDQKEVLRSLEVKLKELSSIGEIRCYSSSSEALKYIPEHRPNLVLMDIGMPGDSGLDCAAELLRNHRRLRVVMFTGKSEPGLLIRCLAVGASGYLLKSECDGGLIGRAVEYSLAGGSPVSLRVVERVFEGYCRVQGSKGGLSPREDQALWWLSSGRQNKEIAEAMRLAPGSVHTLLRRAFKKLGVHTRGEAGAVYLGLKAASTRQALPPPPAEGQTTAGSRCVTRALTWGSN